MAKKGSSGGRSRGKSGGKSASKRSRAKKASKKKKSAKKKAAGGRSSGPARRKKVARRKAPRKKASRKKASAKKGARKTSRKKATPKKKAAAKKKPARKATGKRGKAPRKKTTRRGKAFFEHFRNRLLEERERIGRRLDDLREELSGLQEMPRELEEWAQGEKDRDILIRLEEREATELRRIQAALERIDDGSYGLCQICGRPIPRDRLEELPTAFRCIEHTA